MNSIKNNFNFNFNNRTNTIMKKWNIEINKIRIVA